MPHRSPPPLPRAESAWETYGKAAATLLPAVFVWFFSTAFLLPKLEWLWEETNLGGSRAQVVLDTAVFLQRYMQIVFGIVAGVFLALEFFVPGWPRYRRIGVSIFTVLVHTTVLFALTAISTAVLLAAPLLTRTPRTPPDATTASPQPR